MAVSVVAVPEILVELAVLNPVAQVVAIRVSPVSRVVVSRAAGWGW